MHVRRYAVRSNLRLQNKEAARLKRKVTEIRPDLMFVHGEQADTILASLLALMASLQSLSRCLLVKIVTCPACFVIIAKAHKILLVLLSFTAHPKKISQMGKNNITGFRNWKWRTEAIQTTHARLKFLLASRRMRCLTRCHYPDINTSKTVFSFFARITSHLLRWAMDEQL